MEYENDDYRSVYAQDYGYIERKYKHRRKKRKGLFSLFVFLFVVVAIFLLIFPNVPRAVTAYAGEIIYSRSVMAINKAMLLALSAPITYNDIVKVEKDKNGAVALISANTQQINKIAREIVSQVEKELAAISNLGIDVPLGNLTGFAPLAGIGPKLHIAVNAPQAVTCEFYSELTSLGINQTFHKIYMVIKADMMLLIPLANKSVPTSSQVLIAESIIVGSVPDNLLQITRIG